MVIEINERGSKAFYEELLSVSAMYRRLMRNHTKKLINIIKYYTYLFIITFFLLSLCTYYSFESHFDALYVASAAAMFLSFLISLIYLISFKRMIKEYLNGPKNSKVVIDDQGIEVGNGGNITRLAWDNIAFTRSFTESLCFVGKENSKMIIAITRKYENQILQYIADNNIECRRVG